MTDLIRAVLVENEEWPEAAEKKYERIQILGKGSFGIVWMARRSDSPEGEFDEKYVAVKNIHIKNEKSNVYAEREISILQELCHPNVIRLIRSYPLHGGSRLVVMQLARGPNLHQLVIKRGAIGMPLARLICRQLIAAVSYLHGRAVIHRDIKPSNCIVACTQGSPKDDYDWFRDDAIWDSGLEGTKAVANQKWKLMLVDFGFARALENDEVFIRQSKHLRNSIVYEQSVDPAKNTRTSFAFRNINDRNCESDDHSDEDDDALGKLAETAALSMRGTAFEATNEVEDAIMGNTAVRKRQSGVSMPIATDLEIDGGLRSNNRRISSARTNVRSMSALGTKAYAAPEIRKQLRHKTEADVSKSNAAMTECVADYGMIVDAYSVGWTLRVAMTGVPPNFSISAYMQERESVVMEGEDHDEITSGCCCFIAPRKEWIRIRDPSMLHSDANLLLSSMTEKNPSDRMTVREAQHHPWIAGGTGETKYLLPQGDVPSEHGDPVVPLKCATHLSKLTIDYHMQ